MHRITRPPDRAAPLAGAPAQQGWPAPGPHPGPAGPAPATVSHRATMFPVGRLPARPRLGSCWSGVPERPGAPWGNGNETFGAFMEKKGFRLAPGHPGLTWEKTIEVRNAMSVLFYNPRRDSSLVIHDACVNGFRTHFDALLCLIRNGLLDPNDFRPGRMAGQTLLHSISLESTDDLDHAPGYTTVSERIDALVDAGADIHARDRTLALTALDYARLRKQEVIAQALVRNGAVMDFDSEDDVTPVQWT